MKLAIIGCGLIGQKRARALAPSDQVLNVVDLDLKRAEALARQLPGAQAQSDWRVAVADPRIEAVLVATTNEALSEVALAAVRNKKHVLVEKPAGRYPSEVAELASAAREHEVIVPSAGIPTHLSKFAEKPTG